VNCIFYGEARRSNDLVASFVRAYPDRFIGVGYVTPRYPKEAITELDRCFGELKFKFLKVYPVYYQKPLDDPDFFPIYDWCDERGIVIMSHSQYEHKTRPFRFARLAEKYKNITWVLAHSGNDMNGQIESVEAALSAPNIYLETCTSLSEHGTIEFLVDGVGEDRVLYGSDMPILDARYQLGRIVTADITDEAKRKILGLNAIKLLGI
jgi:predicted TIM-barrel fold metal-dependent hydrolase